MGIDPMADAAGQQGLSPYHAMACNPSTMTDPLGLAAKTEGHAGSFIDYAGEMFRRFPTIMNFMARYVNFGERTASQSMAEQQQMAAEWAKKYYEESTTGGGNAQENNAGTQVEKGAGVDFSYDGTRVSGTGVVNGLDYNRITMTNARGKVKSVNIGNLQMSALDFGFGKGQIFEFENMGNLGLDIWYFLAQNSPYEWSYTEFKYKDGSITGRIATTENKLYELNGGKASHIDEFTVARSKELVYWISVHSHPPPGLNGLSDDKDAPSYGKIMDRYFSEAKMEAYDLNNMPSAYDFFERNRK
ncbi:hypothetical protein D3C71_52710 [compost metagenome]